MNNTNGERERSGVRRASVIVTELVIDVSLSYMIPEKEFDETLMGV